MITPLNDIVLVAVMMAHSPFGPTQLEYRVVDYYSSWASCQQEQRQMNQKQTKKLVYICLKVDKD